MVLVDCEMFQWKRELSFLEAFCTSLFSNLSLGQMSYDYTVLILTVIYFIDVQ